MANCFGGGVILGCVAGGEGRRCGLRISKRLLRCGLLGLCSLKCEQHRVARGLQLACGLRGFRLGGSERRGMIGGRFRRGGGTSRGLLATSYAWAAPGSLPGITGAVAAGGAAGAGASAAAAIGGGSGIGIPTDACCPLARRPAGHYRVDHVGFPAAAGGGRVAEAAAGAGEAAAGMLAAAPAARRSGCRCGGESVGDGARVAAGGEPVSRRPSRRRGQAPG